MQPPQDLESLSHGLDARAHPLEREGLPAGEHDDVAGSYAPPRMPSSYVVDREGVVRYVHAGFRAEDAAALEREVRALLGL